MTDNSGHCLNADLHSHTTASDGQLGPLELYQRARDRGVSLLAITDHDSVEAHFFLRDRIKNRSSDGSEPHQPDEHCPRIITGVEFSTTWSNMEIHIVGLNFSLDHPDLALIMHQQNRARQQRALLIAQKLIKQIQMNITAETLLGEVIGLAMQRQKSTSDGFLLSEGSIQIGRPHFAAWLMQKGYVDAIQPAFDRYLSQTKISNLRIFWPAMSQAVAWIKSLGGTTVVAHPGKYDMTRTKLRALIRDFKLAGGHALEVSGCNQPAGQMASLAGLCVDFNLLASRASDFHTPDNPWIDLGKPSFLPDNVTPVWDGW